MSARLPRLTKPRTMVAAEGARVRLEAHDHAGNSVTVWQDRSRAQRLQRDLAVAIVEVEAAERRGEP